MIDTVFINGRFLSQRLTGVQRYAHETLRALDALVASGVAGGDYRFEVLAPPNAMDPTLARITFRRVGRLSGNAWEQLCLPCAAHGALLLSFGPTGPITKRSQVVTVHDASVHAVPSAFSRLFRTWYKLLLPVLIRRAPLTVTVSRFSRAELIRCFGADASRVRISGEGFEHVLRVPADPSVREAYGLRPGHYVLAVGSMTPHKNFAVVARAAARLVGTPLEVAVAGAVDTHVFGRHVQAEASRMKLLGYVTDAQLRALYEGAAAFVYPSLYEGFGIPPLEAMALGCPVIASRAAAIPEACGDAALYFDPHDDATLARLMRRVVSDEDERKALIARGEARLSHHGWAGAARCQLAVVDEVRRMGRAMPEADAHRVAAQASPI